MKKALSLLFVPFSLPTFSVDEPNELVRARQSRVDGVARNARVGAGEDGGRGVAGELADSGFGGFFSRVFSSFFFVEVERCRVGG